MTSKEVAPRADLASERESRLAAMQELISCARGDVPADLVLKNAKIINVFTGEVTAGDIAVHRERIAGIGTYQGAREEDLRGAYVAPGFIEGHIHIESSMLGPLEFAKAVVPRGTTSVICDPHEIANVAGLQGIDYLLGAESPLAIFAVAPSCVPATHLETSGARLEGDELAELLARPRVLGLGEMMNFPGTVAGMPEVLAKIDAARQGGGIVDGHAPGLSGKALQAYLAAGVGSDHECVTLEDAREKLRGGMYIYLREGSTARNLEALLPLVTPETQALCLLVSDDKDPKDLLLNGHLDDTLRKAVALGLEPLTAIRLVTINPARRFGLTDRGAIAPGYRADLVVFDDLEQLRVKQVYCGGVKAAENGVMLGGSVSGAESAVTPPTESGTTPAAESAATPPTASGLASSMNIDWSSVDFSVPVQPGKLRVIGVIRDQIVTRALFMEPTVRAGAAVGDPDRDLLKIAVIERHCGTGNMSVGFVHGFGLRRGAIASTVAHDSHNLVVVGVTDQEMMLAARSTAAMGGGLTVVEGGEVKAVLPLPIGGLMSDASLPEVAAGLDKLIEAVAGLGCDLANPFMAMAFLALPVIPALKITDQGLVDVERFEFTTLWEPV